MNIAGLFKAVDAAMALREVARRIRGTPPSGESSESGLSRQPPAPGLAGQIEARLTNVVVAALKEAFDRDHARLELERTQLDEQRRRAEEAMRTELRRQAADREIGRLRLLAATAMVGWISSVLMLAAELQDASAPARTAIAAGWLSLLGALAAAFTAQGRIGAAVPDGDRPVDGGASGSAALWLLIAGLAVTGMSLLL